MKRSHYFCLMACGLACASPSIAAESTSAESLLEQATHHVAAGNEDAAFDCCLRAAKLGQPEAQYRLAVMYREGRGAERDFEEYLWWLNKAAEAGHVTAQVELAAHYQIGSFDETPQEEEARNQLAAKWYRRAAEQGHINAQWIMGIFYRFGIGVPVSATDAAAWYRLAAEQGHAMAQCSLADMYEEGEGVPQSFAEAELWYRRAAAQGEEDAIKALEKLPKKVERAARRATADEDDFLLDIEE